MLALEERFMIREMYRKGVSISEIARRTGRDRKTIRQAVNAPNLLPPKTPRQVKACKIDPYAPYLEQRIAEGVLNARKLYGEILAQGYPGKESKVREFVHERRPDKEPMGSVRFETAPGEQGQVDWGSFGFITHHGRTSRLYAFVLTLGWSRASYLRFTISADTTWFIRCHLHAFAYLGGVPKRLLYDNLKSVVLRRDAEDVVQWNPRFLDFADVAGFSPQACKPYRPQTKGKVENGVNMCGAISGRACIFGTWRISTRKRWPGSTPRPIGGCMARLARCRLRDCAWRDYNPQTRRPAMIRASSPPAEAVRIASSPMPAISTRCPLPMHARRCRSKSRKRRNW